MSRAKVKAGGIIRKSADTTWRTPEFVLEAAREFFPGGRIPFDPATGLDNPTKAERFCAGVPGRLFGEAPSIKCAGCPDGCGCDGCWLARQNGLEASWDWSWWVNPPFNREWIQKIGREADRLKAGQNGLALLPCNRFEEPFMQEVLSQARMVCFVDAEPFQRGLRGSNGKLLRGHRIAFLSSIDGMPCDSNPFASMILAFGRSLDQHLFAHTVGKLGRASELTWWAS